jgi:hypothetical protein
MIWTVSEVLTGVPVDCVVMTRTYGRRSSVATEEIWTIAEQSISANSTVRLSRNARQVSRSNFPDWEYGLVFTGVSHRI